MDGRKKRFAFIDVYNTKNTTEELHNFIIDWNKLYDYLKRQWNCEKVFFYSGIEIGDTNTEQEYLELKKLGYEMQIKPVMSYRRRDKIIKIICSNCKEVNTKNVAMGYDKKSNCDSELTVDTLGLATPGIEMCIFTGDGDFAYLIERLVEKGVSVKLVSSNARLSRIGNRRFSSRLRNLLKKPGIDLIEINNLKERIEKIVENSEN
jgi:uncharacterized LabA/DUF88 family protein